MQSVLTHGDPLCSGEDTQTDGSSRPGEFVTFPYDVQYVDVPTERAQRQQLSIHHDCQCGINASLAANVA